MSTVISIENVSKSYRLGTIGSGTLREDLQSWWHRKRGLPDPNLRLDQSHLPVEGHTLWALQDVSLQVDQGEVLGIIGRNGAGKSTLLKILSRVTAPTSGRIRVKGRVASLLEVGTGFHPELTGRENIFLNGAILGMTKAEVARKFDEIVAFSEIEQFIDTPVKRYSSGMYVRLAFAVAAHLEPEILVVDEVLAVGDAAFQKKCLGKMGDVAGEGRTVLFVSHNMIAVQSLCRRAIWLKRGEVVGDGPSAEVVSRYLRGDQQGGWERVWPDDSSAPGSGNVRVVRVAVGPEPGDTTGELAMQRPFRVEVAYRVVRPNTVTHITLHFYNEQGLVLFTGGSASAPGWLQKPHAAGLYEAVCHVPGHLLNSGFHSVAILVVEEGNRVTYHQEGVLGFDVMDAEVREGSCMGREPGVVQPHLTWEVQPALSEFSP